MREENDESAGDVAENVLGGQRDAQRQHRHDGGERRGVDAERLGCDDDGKQIQKRFEAREDDLLQPLVQAVRAREQPRTELEHEPHDDQADEECQQRGKDAADAVAADRAGDDLGNIVHGVSPLSMPSISVLPRLCKEHAKNPQNSLNFAG